MWTLIVEVVITATCIAGFEYCPSSKAPVVTEVVMQTEAACHAKAEEHRRTVPARRPLVKNDYMLVEEVVTVRCVPRTQGMEW